MNRPKTQLFMLMSLDGKISTGDNDEMDFDQDLPNIQGVREGLQQYYDIEKTTDIFSFNTGRVMEKIGINQRKTKPEKIPVTFVIVDNKPHLTADGIKYLTSWTRKLILVTTNQSHPATKMGKIENLEVLHYSYKIDFENLFIRLKKDFNAKRVTIQSGGTLNSILLREGLIDRISLVIVPVLIGGKNTPTLVDGESLHSIKELNKIKPLKLLRWKRLKDSYLHLYYEVLN